MCTWIREDTQRRCGERATDVDHGDLGPDNHSPKNLTSLCSWHHDQKTASQGGAANAAKKKKDKARGRWSREAIPGVIILDDDA